MAILFVVVLHRARFGVELRMLRVIDIQFHIEKNRDQQGIEG